MTSYWQGLLTGGTIVFSLLVVMGQSNNKMTEVMENQTEIIKKLAIHDGLFLSLSKKNRTLKLDLEENLTDFEKEQHLKNLYLTTYIQYLDERIKVK